MPDEGRVVATADFEHDVKVWDLARAPIEPTDWEVRGSVTRAEVSDDGELALVASEQAVEVWDRRTGHVVVHPDAEQTARLLRAGSPLAVPVLGADLRARMEAIVQRRQRRDALARPQIRAHAVSRRARRAVSAPPLPGKGPDLEEPADLVSGRGPGHLWIWDLDDLDAVRRVPGATGWITSLAITGDGRYALTGSQGRMVRLWDLGSGSCVQSLRGHRGMVFATAISDDARYAVTGSEDMTLRLWDLQSGLLLFTFATASAVSACGISRDARVAIAGETSGRVHLFDVRR
jgi:WD40 repeat protein